MCAWHVGIICGGPRHPASDAPCKLLARLIDEDRQSIIHWQASLITWSATLML